MSTPVPSTNRLLNAGFELDADTNSRPDNWTSSTMFTRSSTVMLSGSYAGRHYATSNANYIVKQSVSNVVAGNSYSFSGSVRIPSTKDAFTFKLSVRWIDSNGGTILTDTVKTYGKSSANNTWDTATGSFEAPQGAASADVQMEVTSLKATIYVDEFEFRGP